MHILKIGLNYKTAPVEIREKLTFSEQMIDGAMICLNTQKSILENVIISTCNRTEIYAVVDQIHTGRYYVKQFLADWFEIEKESFTSYLDISENDEAIEGLLRLTAGLDSMILGETQILGQVRDAFLIAQRAQTTGTVFNELFKQAITFAKRAHKDTAIGEHAVSVSYAAIQLAKIEVGNLENRNIVILGAGKMGELAVRNLQSHGATNITVINRTYEKAEMLANRFQAKAAHLDRILKVLPEADILISSTGADQFVLTQADVEAVLEKRTDQKLILIDIAVPRDIDPKVSELENVILYDIDDFQNIVDDNLESRKEAAQVIEEMLESEIIIFKDWLKTLGVVPIISALRDKALSIQAETMKSIERKIPDLTTREKKVLNKHTKSIINQFMKEPIRQAKELASTDSPEEALALFINIFGIKEEVRGELSKQTAKKNLTIAKSQEMKKVSFPLKNQIPSK